MGISIGCLHLTLNTLRQGLTLEVLKLIGLRGLKPNTLGSVIGHVTCKVDF